MRRLSLVLRATTLALVVACAPETGESVDSSDGGASLTPSLSLADTTCDGLAWVADCSGALVLPSGSDIQQVDIEWRWSAGCIASVADPVLIEVPEDIDSLLVTVDAGSVNTAFEVSIDGVPELDYASFGELPQRMAYEAGRSAVWPMGPGTEPSPGCLAIYPLAEADLTGETGTFTVLSRRGMPDATRLQVTGVIVEGTPITEAEVSDALTDAAAVYVDVAGIDVHVVDVVTVPFAAGDRIGLRGDRQELLGQTTGLVEGPVVPVFFVTGFTTGDILGVAAGVPGALIEGTSSSGVVVGVEHYLSLPDYVLDTVAMNDLIGHEIGHQLGLWHSSESTGLEHDALDDTPECTPGDDADASGSVDPWECPDGDNLMFWASDSEPQLMLSADQIAALRASPALLP